MGSFFLFLGSNFYFWGPKNGGPIILFWGSKKLGVQFFGWYKKKLGSNFFWGGAVNFFLFWGPKENWGPFFILGGSKKIQGPIFGGQSNFSIFGPKKLGDIYFYFGGPKKFGQHFFYFCVEVEKNWGPFLFWGPIFIFRGLIFRPGPKNLGVHFFISGSNVFGAVQFYFGGKKSGSNVFGAVNFILFWGQFFCHKSRPGCFFCQFWQKDIVFFSKFGWVV